MGFNVLVGSAETDAQHKLKRENIRKPSFNSKSKYAFNNR